MLSDPHPREYISPVVCWTSQWNNGVLTGVKINKQSRAYKKAYDAECARKTNEQRHNRFD